MRFEKEYDYKCTSTCKLYSMKDESKQMDSRHTYFKHPRSLLNVFLCRTVTISHVRNLHIALYFSENSRISESWVLYRNLEKEFTLLLSCIYYYLHVSTVLDVVRLGSIIRWRRCAPCMNYTRMRCAREKRQHYMYPCKIMWTPFNFNYSFKE